jgi:flagellin-like protein
MANYLKKLRNEQRRAVAPIIATLIMVAIAVVGGVMVYVFTQGFFSGTQTQAPTTDAVSLTGYDAREISGVTDHRGTAIVGIGQAAITGMGTAEEFTLHLDNLGTSDITLGKVEVNFVSLTGYTGDVSGISTGQYTIVTTTSSTAGTGGIHAGVSTIPAGQEVTLVISMPTTATAISAGASIPVEIVTGSGSSFTFHPIVGQRE